MAIPGTPQKTSSCEGLGLFFVVLMLAALLLLTLLLLLLIVEKMQWIRVCGLMSRRVRWRVRQGHSPKN